MAEVPWQGLVEMRACTAEVGMVGAPPQTAPVEMRACTEEAGTVGAPLQAQLEMRASMEPVGMVEGLRRWTSSLKLTLSSRALLPVAARPLESPRWCWARQRGHTAW